MNLLREIFSSSSQRPHAINYNRFVPEDPSLRAISNGLDKKTVKPRLFDQDNQPQPFDYEHAAPELATDNPQTVTSPTPRIGDPATDPALQNPSYVAYLERTKHATLSPQENASGRIVSLIVGLGSAAIGTGESPTDFQSRAIGALQEAPRAR